MDALIKAHQELISLHIGYGNKLGFVLSNEVNGSWRSLTMQKQLVASGASKTLYSNHRRGTAIDCAADWPYISAIKPTMVKHGFLNDLAYIKGDKTSDKPFPGAVAWDGCHQNYGDNTKAQSFPIIDEQKLIKEFTMGTSKGSLVQLIDPGHPGSGGFAFVKDGKKQPISPARLPEAVASVILDRSLTRAEWNAIPTEKEF